LKVANKTVIITESYILMHQYYWL